MESFPGTVVGFPLSHVGHRQVTFLTELDGPDELRAYLYYLIRRCRWAGHLSHSTCLI
jgi:hypothetical protein